ncbi:hypothetical protein [Leadbettera azotonutricia]|nr:hypothetical protein [Leadbettera azotonutricia]
MDKFLLHYFSLTLLLLLPASLFALDTPTGKIEDDSSLRISLTDSWFHETPGRVLNKKAEYHTLKGGGRIQVRVEASKDEFMIVLARELQGSNSYPGWAQGSWVLTRSRSDGAPTRIRIFPRSDPYVYIQFRPFSLDKCQMDVVLYDGYIVRSLPLPISFERLYTLPVEEALASAGDKFPRKYFEADPDMYRDQRAFVSAVRARLPSLDFRDDGAIDSRGDYVFINTLESQISRIEKGQPPEGLNCSGFAKWVVDGILKPLTGELLPIPPLKEPFGNRGDSFTEPWERARDPFFGLDWCRNLASRAGAVLRSPAFAALEEIEVRRWPFSQVMTRSPDGNRIVSYPGFLENAGFGIEGLHPLLYTLAIDEPNRIYLAAVNTETGDPTTARNPRGLPRLRQYFHIAVLVPYFNEYGNFQVTVFESAAETSFTGETAFTGFKSRYPGHFVNLSRVPVDGKFEP